MYKPRGTNEGGGLLKLPHNFFRKTNVFCYWMPALFFYHYNSKTQDMEPKFLAGF